jgi:hypothetical protein
MLTEIEKTIKKLFRAVDNSTGWGLAVERVLNSNDDDQLKKLISQLNDQAKDNPPAMINILGFDLPAILDMECMEESYFFIDFKGKRVEFKYNGMDLGGAFVFVNEANGMFRVAAKALGSCKPQLNTNR